VRAGCWIVQTGGKVPEVWEINELFTPANEDSCDAHSIMLHRVAAQRDSG
jgi:hypothetical protein